MTQKEIEKKINEGIKKEIENKLNKCKSVAENNIFDFIDKSNLKKAIEKSYREAIFIRNLTKEFHVLNTNAHPLNEIIILHYASIYEAIIGHLLSLRRMTKDEKLILKNEIKIRPELKNENCIENKIFRVKMLFQIPDDLGGVISTLYGFRNNIHILKAIEKDEKFTKQLVADFCTDEFLVSFCNKLNEQIQLKS